MTSNDVSKFIFKGKKVDITSEFGRRSYYNNGKLVTDYHTGMDFVTLVNGVSRSSNVYAINNGVVNSIGRDSVSGNYVYIKYETLGIILFYCHLKNIYVKKNQRVNDNTIVGLTGTTGNSTGIHLHLGIKYIGSDKWINPKYFSFKNYNYVYAISKYLIARTKRTTYAVNLRKTAGLTAEVLDIIPKNTTLKLVKENAYKADGYNWDKVKYGTKTGFVANEYLKLLTEKTTELINIRARPSTKYAIVKSLNKNKAVIVKKRKYKYSDGYYWDQIKI